MWGERHSSSSKKGGRFYHTSQDQAVTSAAGLSQPTKLPPEQPPQKLSALGPEHPFSSSQRFWKPTLHTLPVAQAVREEVCLGIVEDVVEAFNSQS